MLSPWWLHFQYTELVWRIKIMVLKQWAISGKHVNQRKCWGSFIRQVTTKAQGQKGVFSLHRRWSNFGDEDRLTATKFNCFFLFKESVCVCLCTCTHVHVHICIGEPGEAKCQIRCFPHLSLLAPPIAEILTAPSSFTWCYLYIGYNLRLICVML